MTHIPQELKTAFRDFGPDKHCVGSFAENDQGKPVTPNNPDAVKWCALGWLLHTYNPDASGWSFHEAPHYAPFSLQLERIAHGLGYTSISEANDTLGYHFIEILRDENT